MDIKITSRSEAETLCLNHASEIRHLLSITDADQKQPIGGFHNIENRLWLKFDDITKPRPGWVHCKRKHVEQIIEFGRKCRAVGGTLLIHCEAGVSRSTAAAFVILCDQMGVTKEEAAMSEMFKIRSQAHPNPVIIAHGDNILGRRGAMVRMGDHARKPVGPYKIIG